MAILDLEVALNYGECSVCFEHLSVRGASVFCTGTTQSHSVPSRVCRHFVCRQCAPTIIPRHCPVCRQDFETVVDVPDPIKEPTKWFQLVDHNQNGLLEFSELVDALRGMLPVDPDALEDRLRANWSTWDTNASGAIDAAEFRRSVSPVLAETHRELRRRIDPELVDFRSRPAEWFSVWDKDGSGTLERSEIARALIKTIPGFTGRDEAWLSETFAAIWILIDPDNDGSISQSEFVMPDGLYEVLMANYPGQ